MSRSLTLLSLSSLLTIIASACVSEGPDERPAEATVMGAEISGILVDEDGCLRVDTRPGTNVEKKVIVWQKDVLSIERRGIAVDLFGGGETPITTWRLGDEIRGGGGSISRQIAGEHAGAGFSERCEGPYFLLGSVDDLVR